MVLIPISDLPYTFVIPDGWRGVQCFVIVHIQVLPKDLSLLHGGALLSIQTLLVCPTMFLVEMSLHLQGSAITFIQ